MKRRWWLPAVIVAVGFIGSLLPVSAQAPSGARPGVTYVGKANVGTDVSIAVSANGSKVERLGFGPAPLTECQTGNEIRDLALDTDGFGVSNLPLLQGFNMWSVHGFFGEAGAAVGGYRQEQTSLFGPNDPALPFVCVLPQYGVFVASDPVSADAIGGGVVPGGRYEGFSQPIDGSGKSGPVRVQISDDGKSIKNIEIQFLSHGCSYFVDLSDIRITLDKMFIAGTPNAREPGLGIVSAVSGITLGRTALRGAFVGRGASFGPGCLAASGQWFAMLTATPTSTPSPVPTPATAATGQGAARLFGTLRAGAAPSLVVFSGGSSESLVTASNCPRAQPTFWTTDSSGAFVTFIPASTIAAVNAAWTTMFASGIPSNTPLVAVCRIP